MRTRLKTGAVLLASCAVLMTTLGASAQDKKPAPSNPVGAGWGAKVSQDAQTSAVTLDEKQTAVVTQVNAYFNALASLKGQFVQSAADGKKAKGKFYVKKPGKFRFDYSLPSKQIIISDGQYLAIQDLDLNNEDRVALDQTPFRLLLRKDVDLIRDARILDAQAADDLIILTLQDKNPDAPGRIKLFLTTKPQVELKEWVTSDAQGLDTRVEISGLDRTDDIDVALFKIQPLFKQQ